jgi:hypothetical protein
MDTNFLIVFALVCGVSYLIYDTYWQGNTEYVESMIDGNKYLVQSLPDKQAAADLLANIRANLDNLVKHLEKSSPSDARVERMVMNFKSERMVEGPNDTKYTSYSINKGEKIVLCLRAKKKENTLMDINTMTFVALHELAHIATESVGHTQEFWDNFRWILEEAINIGIYKKQDFADKPVPYCGITITSSPLDS